MTWLEGLLMAFLLGLIVALVVVDAWKVRPEIEKPNLCEAKLTACAERK